MGDEGGGGGKGKFVVLIGLVVIAAIGWPYLSWFRLEMDIRDAFSDKRLGRFPDSAKIVGLGPELTDLAKKRGFSGPTVELELQARVMGPTTWYYVRASVRSGSHAFVHERRVETKFSEDDLTALSEGGVKVP